MPKAMQHNNTVLRGWDIQPSNGETSITADRLGCPVAGLKFCVRIALCNKKQKILQSASDSAICQSLEFEHEPKTYGKAFDYCDFETGIFPAGEHEATSHYEVWQ
jgi:hypothetical protein